MPAFDYQLLLKHILTQGVAWAPDQEIIYRDQVRYTYSAMYQRVLRLGGALQALGVKPGTGQRHQWTATDANVFWHPSFGAVLHTINPRLAPETSSAVAHAEDRC
jgi:fatty-acyl-CoA synthase